MYSKIALPALCLLILLAVQCGPDKKPKRPPKTHEQAKNLFGIYFTPDSARYTWGMNMSAVINWSDSVETDTISVYFNDSLLSAASFSEQKAVYELTNSLQRLGENHLRIETRYKNKAYRQIARLTLFSDIRPRQQKISVVQTYPHDKTAYTQGLFYQKGYLYEGTGLEGASSLRKVKLETGEVLQKTDAQGQYFCEGITPYNNEIIQLTWRSNTGFVYNAADFKLLRTFTYDSEGWGITTADTLLVMSDGSFRLVFLDPATFKPVKYIDVYDDKGPVRMLNELEYARGRLYANIYQSEEIAEIDITTGRLIARFDCSGLLKPDDMHPRIDVLNGIAYNPQKDVFYITGKNWPKLFEIRIPEKQEI